MERCFITPRSARPMQTPQRSANEPEHLRFAEENANLLRAYIRSRLGRGCRDHDIEECLQETYSLLLEITDSEVPPYWEFEKFVCKVARRAADKRHRRNKREYSGGPSLLFEGLHDQHRETPEECARRNEIVELYAIEMGKAPPDVQPILELFLQDMSISAIRRTTGMPRGRIQKVVDQIKRKLARTCDLLPAPRKPH